ncbi:hypothetical protein K413DRAFT_4838 [Clostridium sp. ASBs410]|nr:hypothetical protein K413DRAFT_4838 [Clostridium sp. ASBs410]
MRLYSMYFICKGNIDVIENIKIENLNTNSGPSGRICGWLEIVKALNKLANVPGLKEVTTKLYESVPIFVRNRDVIELNVPSLSKFDVSKRELASSINTIILMYEQMGLIHNADPGFDMKLPQFESIKDFSNCIKDVEFIFNQCPYLRIPNGEIKFKSADVGSFWITFFIAGTAASAMLINLSKVIDAAVKIKSHVVTVKQQEEALRAMDLKNGIASDIFDTFRQVNKSIIDKCVHELEADLGPLKDGEEVGKVGKSIEKLAEWMDKGLQIYSAIDAPQEVRDLFPPQEEQPLLNNEIIKLIEQKENNKD